MKRAEKRSNELELSHRWLERALQNTQNCFIKSKRGQHSGQAVGSSDWLGRDYFESAAGTEMGDVMPSSSGAGPGIEFVFCATTTIHFPLRFSTSIMSNPNRVGRGEPSKFLSPWIFQLQCTTGKSGRRKRTAVSSAVNEDSRKRPLNNRL